MKYAKLQIRLAVLERFTPPGLTLPMHMIWHERTAHDAVCQRLREHVRAAVSEATPPRGAPPLSGRSSA